MRRSGRTIVPSEPTKTVHNAPDDSREQRERPAVPHGERRRVEVDRFRKKEGQEDRHDPGHEIDRQGPARGSESYSEMFFG